jgi:hypothetical protein
MHYASLSETTHTPFIAVEHGDACYTADNGRAMGHPCCRVPSMVGSPHMATGDCWRIVWGGICIGVVLTMDGWITAAWTKAGGISRVVH